MGIKEIFKSDKCISCGEKLEVFAWTKCRKCDVISKRYKERLKIEFFKKQQIKKAFNDVVFKCDKEKAIESDLLVFDDITNEIIGYRSSIIKPINS